MEKFDYFKEMLDKCPKNRGVYLLSHSLEGDESPKHFDNYYTKNEKFKVFNSKTRRVSDKSVYENTRGKYIKVSLSYHSKVNLYLKDFK